MRGDMSKPKTLEEVIKTFAMGFSPRPINLKDKTNATMFARELAKAIREWKR